MGPWSTDLEPCLGDSLSRLKLRGSRLVDAEPGLLGLVAGSGSNWLEGVGLYLAGLAACALTFIRRRNFIHLEVRFRNEQSKFA